MMSRDEGCGRSAVFRPLPRATRDWSDEASRLGAGLSIPAIIEYRDGLGDQTERTITIDAVYGERLRVVRFACSSCVPEAG